MTPPPSKALQRTRISAGCFPWRSVRAAELGRYATPEVHKIVKVIIETQRLKIVEVTIDDIDLLYQLTGNKDVMRYFPKMLNYDDTRQMTRKILDHYKKYGHCFWKVLLKPKNEFVGITGLLHQEIDGKVETEIAFRIRPEHWNNGYPHVIFSDI